mmetsp:Transcript_66354/g.173963  ORF Transcript_66354/g.173963 Transcript_66354/m.173963 type:complete len:280 (-) Transcript_66354:449-1288(-)
MQQDAGRVELQVREQGGPGRRQPGPVLPGDLASGHGAQALPQTRDRGQGGVQDPGGLRAGGRQEQRQHRHGGLPRRGEGPGGASGPQREQRKPGLAGGEERPERKHNAGAGGHGCVLPVVDHGGEVGPPQGRGRLDRHPGGARGARGRARRRRPRPEQGEGGLRRLRRQRHRHHGLLRVRGGAERLAEAEGRAPQGRHQSPLGGARRRRQRRGRLPGVRDVVLGDVRRVHRGTQDGRPLAVRQVHWGAQGGRPLRRSCDGLFDGLQRGLCDGRRGVGGA